MRNKDVAAVSAASAVYQVIEYIIIYSKPE